MAGIVLEHQPVYRLVVVLTGPDPVSDQSIATSTMTIPVVFHTGAPATRSRILEAIDRYQAEIRAELPHPPGMGVDARRGMLMVTAQAADVGADGSEALAARLGDIAGVPVEIRAWSSTDKDFAIEGAGRVVGPEPADGGRLYLCTTGFVVTDGTQTGVTTAAHCPDHLSYREPDGGATPLTMIGAWGARYQDVQIHVSGQPLSPLFYANSARSVSRALATWRNRASTRVGDFVCHRGERSGYSCAEVEIVDYAPPGDLCAGPCPPSWVVVRGPHCRSGDSGGPVFSGSVAFGTVKGGSYAADGSCRFYFYMSTDYLPPGWTLLYQ